MNRSPASAASVQALRLGLDASRVLRFALPVTIEPETLVLRCAEEGPAPLLLCLHPARMTELQFALRLRDLSQAPLHVAFPRGLHAHEVDLGGARGVGYSWCHYTGDNPVFRDSLACAMTYLDRVQAHLIERLPVRRDAVFVLGAEDAALTATAYAAARRDQTAGAITIGGQMLPDMIGELTEGDRRLRFLHIDDRVRWLRRPPRIRGPMSRHEAEELRQLGFPVDIEAIPSDVDPWIDTVGRVVAWITRALLPTARSSVRSGVAFE
jgi:hypothetical protein